MHIKQIIIQGFKSYKEQTVIEPFSSKHNVIVGHNGSGKSNFFAAIRFVLGDDYNSMTREDRQSLLHEGSGSAVMSAYVEVIFDNTGARRFPTDRPELILRRTIGTKKDEFSLDRKNATRMDVNNLLEAAGFSRSNPYYIVPQGRVTALTNMKDSGRLNVLKDVAGTQVYENRRAESLDIMTKTDDKRAKIDELLTYITNRLEELEEEKEELKEYQDSDRERRCLEYTIYHREQEEVRRQLENLEELQTNGAEDLEDKRQNFLQGDRELNKIGEEIRSIEQRLSHLELEKKQLEEERAGYTRKQASKELDVDRITEAQTSRASEKTRDQGELRKVQNDIREHEAALQKLMPQYSKIKAQEDQSKSQLDIADSLQKRLNAKQGRNAKFKSKKDRDDWLTKQIADLNINISRRKATMMDSTDRLNALQTEQSILKKQIEELRSEGGDVEDGSIISELTKAKELRDRLEEDRRILRNEDAKLDSVLRGAKQELDRAQKSLSKLMSFDIRRGLDSLPRIQQQLNIDGVYGTVADLMQVSERYKTAVDVAAGDSLFHVVVSTERVAKQLQAELFKQRAGRLTFMPLDDLEPKSVALPKTNDVVSVMSRIEFNARDSKAFEQIFGKSIVCENLEIASQYARSLGVTAVTPDGDRADKKGALSGGYRDPRQSRLDAVQAVSKWRAEYESHKHRINDIHNECDSKDQEITRARSDIEKISQRRKQFERNLDAVKQTLHSKRDELQANQTALEGQQDAQRKFNADIVGLGEQQAAYEEELRSAFKKELSDDEEQQLESLSVSIPKLRSQYAAINANRVDLESQKSTIESALKDNLLPRLEQIQQQRDDVRDTSSTILSDLQNDLERLNKRLDRNAKSIQDSEVSIEATSNELSELKKRETLKTQEQEEAAEAIERFQRRTEKAIGKKSILVAKADEVNHNIRELGPLPNDAFAKYSQISSAQALKRLHKVKEVLKKYSHVNKKALEQYNNFLQQRSELNSRRSELEKSQASIRDLIDVLDQRKDEAIWRTFKQVSKEFSRIFERLVPAGTGKLLLQRGTRDAEESDDESGQGRVGDLQGVSIAVSFNSKHDEQQRIQQLSGGQKSLCALTLVFAIQQCDPAPFYLFDEIDANLDAQYRTAVAALLQQTSESGQFICTTFRPEMLHVAEKVYGVTYSNKTSSIDVVDKETAMDFIEGNLGRR